MQNIALIINTLQGGGAERCAADLSLIFTEKDFRYIFLRIYQLGLHMNMRERLLIIDLTY